MSGGRLVTIGVYGFDAPGFLTALRACHRSLVAARLAAEHGVTVTDLAPAGGSG